jgi:molybdopterin converting factor small subunit
VTAVRVRLFGPARQAAGTGADVIEGETVGEVLAFATARYGAGFAALLTTCQVWVNGEAADAERPMAAGDELAVLPPVSGGAL